MAENIMQIMNLFEFCDRTKESALILSIDFFKAFDCLEWEAVFEALKLFNIGDTFLKYLKVLYNQPLSTVMNNGSWSDWFGPTRGCRQGDPISPTIFALTLEILGLKIRINAKIRGFRN